jgi:nucleotide-binding universal stress UspA family protein
MSGSPIVVGVYYSPASDAALAWALDAAVRRDAELRIVHVCELSQRQLEALGESATRLRGQVRDRGQQLLDESVRIAAKSHPDVRVARHLCFGSAARRLVTESTRADLLVVGNLGLGGFAGLLLGSTALYVASFAHNTVVAVPASAGEETTAHGVVVGVDEPRDAQAALRFAFREASDLAEPLTAVHAWHVPYVLATGPYGVPPLRYEFEPLSQVESALLDSALDGWPDRHPEVEIITKVPCGHPVMMLAEEAKDARLIVVGTRGRGEVRGLVFGSVSHALLHHAPCPVAIVR